VQPKGNKKARFAVHSELRPYYHRRIRTCGIYMLVALVLSIILILIVKLNFLWSLSIYVVTIWVGALVVAVPVYRHARFVYGKATDLLSNSKPVKMKVTLNRLAVTPQGKESWMATVTEEDGLRAALKGREQVMAIDPGSACVLDSSLLGMHYFDAYCGFDPSDPIVIRTPRGPIVLIARADDMLHHEANLHMESARKLIDRGEYTAAVDAATVAIGRDPTYWMAYTFRAHSYLNMNEQELSLADFDRAISLRPTDEELYYSRGMVLAALGRHREAIDDFGQCLSIDPKYKDAYVQRAAAYFERERLSEGIDDLSQVLELDENDRDALMWRAGAYVQQRRYYLAIDDLDRAIEMNPENAQAYFYRSLALKEIGEFTRAEQDYRRAVELDPALDE
jgi:tetratricopeptide (TPR) repeat protein